MERSGKCGDNTDKEDAQLRDEEVQVDCTYAYSTENSPAVNYIDYIGASLLSSEAGFVRSE